MQIETEKSLIVGPSAPHGVKIDVGPKGVLVTIEHDGVKHLVAFEPNEAVGFGVTLIQASGHAGMIAAQLAKEKLNGLKLVPPQ